MNGKDIIALGFSEGKIIGTILEAAKNSNRRSKDVKLILKAIKSDPKKWVDDAVWGVVASELIGVESNGAKIKELLDKCNAKPFKVWGEDIIEPQAIEQMKLAMELPVTVKGALVPDAHFGKAVPIGGILGCDALIPNAVGVDIACRVKLSLIDFNPDQFWRNFDSFKRAIVKETRFGTGQEFEGREKRNHAVLDDERWKLLPPQLRDKAHSQLGTSGSGNHFVSVGTVNVQVGFENVQPGKYIAILSHSGSRGTGAWIAQKYKDVAISKLPKELEKYKNLAWLDPNSEAGQEYWQLMNLMGDYASACHQKIHESISDHLGVKIIGGIENHHNFCWQEEHDGKLLYVHRKGATPAGKGVLGIIPGTMADDCWLVSGKGNPDSLYSSSHGAGRAMSRTAAREKFSWGEWRKILKEKGVHLISSGIDEVPGSYKPIEEVMKRQEDLVDRIGVYNSLIVKMADDGKSDD
jgi:tRNA-splicing ligase RtcB (3'-phosphate/5'-hydroxy nucleic acid ligase)